MLSLVAVFYSGFTVFLLLATSVSTLAISDLFSGIVLMWVVFLVFAIGWNTRKTPKKFLPFETTPYLASAPNAVLAFLAFASIICAVLATEFYTGMAPGDIFRSAVAGDATYYTYQQHFQAAGIAEFSIGKIPYIGMLAFVKLNGILALTSLVASKVAFSAKNLLYIFVSAFSFVYVGFGRGTNIEMFEFGLLAVFSLTMRGVFAKHRVRTFLAIIVALFAGVTWFYFTMQNRYSQQWEVSSEVAPGYYFVESAGSNGSMTITLVSLLFGYFGFGFIYTSTFLDDVVFRSPLELASYLLPKGMIQSEISDPLSFVDAITEKGVKWHPDTVTFFLAFGVIIYLLFLLFFGYLGSHLEHSRRSEWSLAAQYFVFLQMASLPIGGFVGVSSANILSIGAVVTVLLISRASVRSYKL